MGGFAAACVSLPHALSASVDDAFRLELDVLFISSRLLFTSANLKGRKSEWYTSFVEAR